MTTALAWILIVTIESNRHASKVVGIRVVPINVPVRCATPIVNEVLQAVSRSVRKVIDRQEWDPSLFGESIHVKVFNEGDGWTVFCC